MGETGVVFPDWSPLRGLDALLSAGRSILPVPTTPAGVLEAAVRVAADRLRDRRVTVRAADRDVSMTVVDLAVSGDTVGLAQGRVGAVLLSARDVGWPGLPLERLEVRCHDVRFAGPLSTKVVVGEIRLAARISSATVAAAVTAADARLSARVLGGQVWVRRRPWPGELRVVPEVDGARLLARPVAVRVGRWSRPIAPAPVDIPVTLPKGLRISAVAVSDDGLAVEATATDWRDRLSGTPVAELVSLLTTAATTLTVGLLPANPS
jgi:hypothetical protein